MQLGHATELALPIAVEDHPVDMTAPRISFPKELSRSVEVDVQWWSLWGCKDQARPLSAVRRQTYG